MIQPDIKCSENPIALEGTWTDWWKITPGYARSRGVMAIAFLAALQLGSALGAESIWWLELPVHFQAQYLLLCGVALGAIAYAGARERRFTWSDRGAMVAGLAIASYAAALVLGWTPGLRELAAVTADIPRPERIRILSANLYTNNRQHQAILDLIDKEQPDLVFLMELNSRWEQALTPLSTTFPFRRVRADDSGNFGIGIWSRLPVEECSFDDFGSLVRQVHLVAQVAGPEGPRRVRIVGVHPLPPISAFHWSQRNRAFEGITTMRNREASPTIVVGDLNATRYAPRFQALCRDGKLYDAGHATYGRSWPAGTLHAFMGIRIDHLLVSQEWEVCRFELCGDIGSDHYPVCAEIQLVR